MQRKVNIQIRNRELEVMLSSDWGGSGSGRQDDFVELERLNMCQYKALLTLKSTLYQI